MWNTKKIHGRIEIRHSFSAAKWACASTACTKYAIRTQRKWVPREYVRRMPCMWKNKIEQRLIWKWRLDTLMSCKQIYHCFVWHILVLALIRVLPRVMDIVCTFNIISVILWPSVLSVGKHWSATRVDKDKPSKLIADKLKFDKSESYKLLR
jgi:hypothetical protein